jgi:hypothetical protein
LAVVMGQKLATTVPVFWVPRAGAADYAYTSYYQDMAHGILGCVGWRSTVMCRSDVNQERLREKWAARQWLIRLTPCCPVPRWSLSGSRNNAYLRGRIS